MTSDAAGRRPARASEARLDALREEARRTGRVDAAAARVTGGPIPLGDRSGARPPALGASDGGAAGYYGRPVVKPPIWTWEIPLYFFVGGLAGMAAVLALAARGTGAGDDLVRTALRVAVGGAIVSPVLLTMDLGRPARFLNMLRVFKPRSAMSVGAWVLTAFGGAVTGAALLDEWIRAAPPEGALGTLVEAAFGASLVGGALLGAVLATYTGVLIGATAIPAWHAHVRMLPAHFGVAGLGSAAALLELLGFRAPALHAIGLAAAGLETLFAAWIELRRHGAADRALREGRAGWLLRASGVLAGPAALGLRLAALVPGAAAVFLVGTLVNRYGWLAAGRASGRDPAAVFAARR